MFRSRVEPFPWDWSTCVELSTQSRSRSAPHLDVPIHGENDLQAQSGSVEQPREMPEYAYNIGSFVAVNTGGAVGQFWIARVESMVSRTDANGEYDCNLRVRWYEPPHDTTDALSARYSEAFIMKKRSRKSVVR